MPSSNTVVNESNYSSAERPRIVHESAAPQIPVRYRTYRAVVGMWNHVMLVTHMKAIG